MAAVLVPLPLERMCAPGFWKTSPPVAVRPRPAPRPAPALDVAEQRKRLWFQALDALGNRGEDSLGYDEWFRVVSAIHHETGGSAEGLAVAQWWSARSEKHDPAFLESRVWPYLRPAADRASAVTGGTIMALAARLAGWAGAPEVRPEDGFVPVDGKGRPIPGAVPVAAVGAPAPAAPVGEAGGAGAYGPAEVAPGVVVGEGRLADSGLEFDEVVELAEREGIPPANHLCTDQANANRLVREFGAHLMVAAGSWYVWDGRRWVREEAGVYRRACALSAVIMAEAAKVRRRIAELVEGTEADADERAAQRKRLGELAEALVKWSTKSEMKGTIEAAIGLARKMLTVEVESLDRNPWLLNVANGTVDLRTGELRGHELSDRITKVIEVDYVPGARSALWERLLSDVCRGDAALVRFLRRWLGYCLTGSVREQKLVVHWGVGGNGKSTVLDAVADVMGDYAATAASGLVASRKGAEGVHSSAVVALVGRRMVSAHESDEGAALNESFIKLATGGDPIPARYLFGEQFEFLPSHKFNLITNHKPVVRGTDEGIWRRLRLMPWLARFGTAEQLARGEVDALADVTLGARLRGKAEREGILADLVLGCLGWLRGESGEGAPSRPGLCEPDAVLAAGEDYRTEQDRLAQFVREWCEVAPAPGAPGFEVPLVGVAGDGLYPQYTAWCRESGTQPIGKVRFSRDLARVVPSLRIVERNDRSGERRRKISLVQGLRLLPE